MRAMEVLLSWFNMTSRIQDMNMTSSQFVGDIDMETITPTNSSIMLECNRAREELKSSKRLKGIEKISEKK